MKGGLKLKKFLKLHMIIEISLAPQVLKRDDSWN